MNYKNPWSDCSNFIYLGEMHTKQGQLVDLYALKDHYSTGKPHYQIGVRYSDEPSDYGSGSRVRFDNNQYQTSAHHTIEAFEAMQRLIKQVIQQPIYSDRYENKLLFDEVGCPCATFNLF